MPVRKCVQRHVAAGCVISMGLAFMVRPFARARCLGFCGPRLIGNSFADEHFDFSHGNRTIKIVGYPGDIWIRRVIHIRRCTC